MADFMILVYEDGVPQSRHFVRTPEVSDSNFYRQATSLDAFRTREAKRLHEQHKKGIKDVVGKRSWVRWYDEYSQEVKVVEESMKKYVPDYTHHFSATPEFFHNTVWDFYKQVGYDYKRKKYV